MERSNGEWEFLFEKLKAENRELEAKLTEAQADIERLRGALKKVAKADCPTYVAHPQSVWWNEHVVSKATEALAEGKEEK